MNLRVKGSVNLKIEKQSSLGRYLIIQKLYGYISHALFIATRRIIS